MADTSESGVPGETGGAGAEADAAAARPAGLASLRTSGGNLPGMRAAGGEESGSVPTGAAMGGPAGGSPNSGSAPVVGPLPGGRRFRFTPLMLRWEEGIMRPKGLSPAAGQRQLGRCGRCRHRG